MSVDSESQPSPRLAPPGAGLPKLELWLGRRMFARKRRKHSREEFGSMLAGERDLILELVRDLSEKVGTQRVLIDRIRGIEDSSRHWSAFMTLEHLRVVNMGIAGVIRSLGRGESFGRPTRIEDVKPDPAAGADSVASFEQSCALVEKAASAVADLHTEKTHDHPWFGPLDAFGWFAMAALHLRIHRGQIEKILAGLE